MEMQTMAATAQTPGSIRGRAQAFAETWAASRRKGESLSELAHDARNMVMALALYCDLLEEPGVLSISCQHYASELRLVAASSLRLVEKLALLGKRDHTEAILTGATKPVALSLAVPEKPIEDLREEVLACWKLMDALAGPQVAVTISAAEGALRVWLTTEDLTRVLVNLVKNAAEAIAGVKSETGSVMGTGWIEIGLRERAASADAPSSVRITVEDSGPGIDPAQLEAIFEPGFTTNVHAKDAVGTWPAAHRGLGLFICRSIVEAAGGRMLAGNRGRMGTREGGARIEIELPVRTR
ncbi:MAG TPA: HAMP domain-containing sensor histidine kinase [Terracidiphilus sp.]